MWREGCRPAATAALVSACVIALVAHAPPAATLLTTAAGAVHCGAFAVATSRQRFLLPRVRRAQLEQRLKPTALCAKYRNLKRGYERMEPLRVVSYNIKGFGVGFGISQKTPEEVADAYAKIRRDLARLRPHVICLNEVMRFPFVDPEGNERPDSLEALAEDLTDPGMDVRFAHATPGFERFGNAILTAPGIELFGNRSIHLNGGSVVRTKDGKSKRIIRSMLVAHLKIDQKTRRPDPLDPQPPTMVAIASTHWDHISDLERQRQAATACYLLDDLCDGLPHLVVGDLNAIKRSDYSPKEWQDIVYRNSANGWDSPADSDSLQTLENAGYQDLHQRTLAGMGSALATVPSEYKLTAPAERPNVRIDYAYMSPSLCSALEDVARGSSSPGEPSSFPAKAFVDRGAIGSDHFPLCIELPRR